jgi:hypothetical protein
MGSDNLLVDWFDPNDNANSSSDYSFDHILVTIRAYGIPRNRRSVSLLADILNQIGAVSEFHILQENNLFAKQDYIWGTTKMKVNSPVKDRAILTYADNSTDLAYLHYEKIGRICLFCGIMFHNVEHCSLRNDIIRERSKNRIEGPDVPTQRYGKWIIDEKHIPNEVIQTTRIASPGNNPTGSAIIARLQRLFVEDPKGKRKVEEQQASRKSFMQGQFHSNRMTQENRLHTPYGTVHPCEASHGGDLGSDMMHGRHLALLPGTTHNYGHQPNKGDKGSKETNIAKEGPHNTIEGMQIQGLVSQGMGTSISSLPQEETT